MKQLIITIVLICLWGSCTNDELCEGVGTNEIKLSFKNYESGSALSITLDSIGFSWKPLMDTLYLDTTVTFIGLPVDPDTSVTQFVFVTADRTDTLEIGYHVSSSLISAECGPELLFSQLDTIYHTFDSLAIIQNIFDREVETNIELFY